MPSLFRSRGAGSDADAAGSSAPTSPPPIRQRRRPAVIALALALIAVCGLGAFALAKRSGETVPVVVAARDIHPGKPIVADDLRVVDVGTTAGIAATPADQRDKLIGRYAAADVPNGTLIHPSMTIASLSPRSGTSIVGVLAKAGQMPSSGLHAGDKVRLVYGYGPNAAAPATAIKPGTAWGGVVIAVFDTREAGTKVVDVNLQSPEAEAVATVASTGLLTVTLQGN